MIDYASVTPMMSLSAALIGFIVLSLEGAAIAEYIVNKRNKSPQELGGVQASRQAQLSASQKAVQRYYSRKGA